MSSDKDPDLPGDLAEVADALRRSAPGVSPLQLDAIKRTAMMRVPPGHQPRGPFMKKKIATLSLAATLALTGGAAGVMATGNDKDDKSAAKSQYSPGKGCGAKKVKTGPPGNPDAKDCPPKAANAKCNAGRGNGSEPVVVMGREVQDCDPGNSGGRNNGGD